MSDTVPSTVYDIFVSYNGKDRAQVVSLVESLRQQGSAVFFDRWELQAGRSWTEALERHLLCCRSFVIFIGPSGIGNWQHREKYLALDRQSRDSDFAVVPVLLPGSDPPLGFLFENTWIDLRDGVDADAAQKLFVLVSRDQQPVSELIRCDKNARDICPYRGLEAFREEDAAFYFGREAMTQQLFERLQRQNLIAVVGASGSGKSSMVRAGLVPMLRRTDNDDVWDILIITPGVEPLVSLARALEPSEGDSLIATRAILNTAADHLSAGTVSLSQSVADYLARQPGTHRLLLVVDQFEELVTLASNVKDASRFIELLLEATGHNSPLSVVITLRSDFYSEIVSRRELNDRLQDAVVNVGPFSGDAAVGELSELETIIRHPADAVGLTFEDGLIERIVTGVGNEPGNLPLLEYLLTALWRQRRDVVMTHDAFDQLGGVQGAITQRAEQKYAKLSNNQQRAARRLFLSLVRPVDGQNYSRCPSPFPDDAAEADVMRQFAGPEVRLLVTDDGVQGRTVQVSHEALIHGWSRLRGWVDEDHDTLRARQRVRERMHRWRSEHRVVDLLLPPGLELEEGRRLLSDTTDVSMTDVRDYIELSIVADDERLKQERKRQKQKYRLIGTALMVSLLLTAIAGWQWQKADDARNRAQSELMRADSERDKAIAQRIAGTAVKVLDENPGQSALAAMLAVESQVLSNTPEANAVLRDVLALTAAHQPALANAWVHDDLHLSGDAKVLALETRARWSSPTQNNPEAWTTIEHLRGANMASLSTLRLEGLMQPLISPDGRWMVSAGQGRRLIVSALDNLKSLVDVPSRSATFPIFSPTGDTLYVAYQTGVIEVRRAPTFDVTGTLSFPVDGARQQSLKLGITADGKQLLISALWLGAYVVPVDGSQTMQLEIHVDQTIPSHEASQLSDSLVAPHASIALTRQSLGESELWDMATGARLLKFRDSGRASAATFSPDGQMLATADSEGNIVVRAVADGVVKQRWLHHESEGTYDHWITGLTFSTKGDLLASAGREGEVVVRSVPDGIERLRFSAGDAVRTLAFDPVDDSLLIGTGDGELIRINHTNGEVLARQQFEGAVTSITAGGLEGAMAISLSDSACRYCWHDIRFIERSTGMELSSISFNGELRSSTISHDGRLFAARDMARKNVIVWDTATGDLLMSTLAEADQLQFTADSQRLLMHSYGRPLETVDVFTGMRLHELGEPGGIQELASQPYNDIVITRGYDGSLRSWNLATGESRWSKKSLPARSTFNLSGNGSHFSIYDESTMQLDVVLGDTAASIGKVSNVDTDRLILNDDGTRLISISELPVTESNESSVYKVDILDTHTPSRLINRLPISSRHVRVLSISTAMVGLLSMGAGDGSVHAKLDVIDWDSGEVIWTVEGRDNSFMSVLMVDDSKDQIMISTNSSIQMYAMSTGMLLWKKQLSSPRKSSEIPGTGLVAVSASKGSQATRQSIIRLLNSATGKEHLGIVAGGFVSDLAATADGLYVVAAIDAKDFSGVRVWRVNDGTLVHDIELDARPKSVLPLRAPHQVAVLDLSGNLRVFDLRDGSLDHRIVHGRSASSVIAATGNDRAVTQAGASLRFWDTYTGQEIAHRITNGEAHSISISSDGKRIAYLSDQRSTSDSSLNHHTAVIWTPDDAIEPVKLAVENIRSIEFDPSGRYLALLESVRGRGVSIRVLDASTRRTEFTVRALRLGDITGLEFASDGDMLLVTEKADYGADAGGIRYGMRVFDIDARREIIRQDVIPKFQSVTGSSDVFFQDVAGRWRHFQAKQVSLDPMLYEGRPDQLAATPNSYQMLASSYHNKNVLLDSTTEEVRLLSTEDEPFNVLHSVLDSSGQFVVQSRRERNWREDSTGYVVILDASDGSELARLKTPKAMWRVGFAGNSDVVIMSETRNHLPTVSESLLMHWNWRKAEHKVLVDDNTVPLFAISPDGKRMVTIEGNRHPDSEIAEFIGEKQLRIWDAEEGIELVRQSRDFDASVLVFSPNGQHVAAGDALNEVVLLRSADAGEVARFKPKRSYRVEKHEIVIDSISGRVRGGQLVAFAQGGRQLAIAMNNGVALFDVASGNVRRLPAGEKISSVTVSPDGLLLAMAGDQLITVWEVESGQQVFHTELPGVNKLLFSGLNGHALFGVRELETIHIRWQAAELRTMACRAFRQGDWRIARARLLNSASASHPCDVNAAQDSAHF